MLIGVAGREIEGRNILAKNIKTRELRLIGIVRVTLREKERRNSHKHNLKCWKFLFSVLTHTHRHTNAARSLNVVF